MTEYYAFKGNQTTITRNADGTEVFTDAEVLSRLVTVHRVRANHPGGKPKSGRLAPNPYLLHYNEIQYPIGRVVVRDGNGRPMERIGPWGALWNYGMNNVPPGSYDNLVQRAINDALSQLKDNRANLAVALLEAKQTAALLTSNAERIADVWVRHRDNIGRLMRGRSLRAFIGGKDWRKLPALWLEAQFAVKPLIADVDGAFSAVINSASKDNLGLGVAVRGSAKDTQSWKTQYVNNNGYNLQGYSKRSEGVRVRLDYTSSERALEAAKRVGLTNPLAAAWEATRMSWLVDYFYSIGDAIDLMDATAGFSFVSGSYSYFSELEEHVYPLDDPRRESISISPGFRRTVDHWRVPYYASPTALPVARIGITPSRLANMLSVLSQQTSAVENLHRRLRM